MAETQFPPLQPPLRVSHFSKYCSARSGGFEVGTLFDTSKKLSKKATVAKAQQLPQFPWSLTGVTFELALQSISGVPVPTKVCSVWVEVEVEDEVEVCKFLLTLLSWFRTF